MSAAEGLRRRSVAVLAVDLCGYSRLVAHDEAGTLARLLADRQLIGEIVQSCAGRVFNTAGDALLAEFGTATEALRAAIAVQQRIERRAAAEAGARRMRYRMGMTVGEVVEDGGDLLGDAVNVAARLEKLAEPGGLCLSRAAREAAGTVPQGTRDIGPQRLKNLPRPVPACLVPPESIGGARGSGARLFRSTAATVLGLVLVAGAAAALSPRRVATAALGDGTGGVFVSGPAPELPPAPMLPHGRLALDAVPFVDDAARARLAAVLAKDPRSAVAITRSGVVGTAPAGRDPARAGAGAVRACFEAGGTNCRLFAVEGEVVWPEPLPPLPPRPWVDPTVAPTPFDAARIAGLRDEARRRMASDYPDARPFKALALGPRGTWSFRSDKASAEEAERLALEACGEYVGTPCRIVAVGDRFVVPLRPR